MTKTKQTARVGRIIKEVGPKPVIGVITKEKIVKPLLKPKKTEKLIQLKSTDESKETSSIKPFGYKLRVLKRVITTTETVTRAIRNPDTSLPMNHPFNVMVSHTTISKTLSSEDDDEENFNNGEIELESTEEEN